MAKILIAEDERAINDLIKLNLTLVGHKCDQVFDCAAALECIYLEYDKIVMPDFSEHTQGAEVNLRHSTVYLYDKAQLNSVEELYRYILDKYNNYESCECDLTVKYVTIEPYHGDFSEYEDYESAFTAYDAMITEIERVISERLRILDTGTLFYCSDHSNSSYIDHMYGILLDGGSNGDYAGYTAAFEDRAGITKNSTNVTSVDTPYLIANRVYNAFEVSSTANIHYVSADGVKTKLFPTAELDAIRPRGPVHLS